MHHSCTWWTWFVNLGIHGSGLWNGPPSQGPHQSQWSIISRSQCFPDGASGQEPTCQYRRGKRQGFDPWLRKIPWRRECLPTPVFLPGESHGQMNLVGWSPWGRKASGNTDLACMQACIGHLHIPPWNAVGMLPRWLGLQAWIPEALQQDHRRGQLAPSFLSPGTGGLFGWDPWAIPRHYPNGHRACLGPSRGRASLKVSPERKRDRAEVLDKRNFWAGLVQKFPVKCFTSRLGKDWGTLGI